MILEKLHLYLSCTDEDEMWDWATSILKAQHDDQQPVVLRRRSSSDLARQKFGTMPLLPIRGDDSGATLLSANQTLRRLHNRRTLSMFFPMKSSQGSVEEQEEVEEPVYEEPVYEEVGAFPELTGDTLSSFSSTQEWAATPDTPLTSQRSFDQPPASKAHTLGQEEGPPEPPPGPPSKSSPQARGSLEEQLLQELSSLILRKGDTTACLGSPPPPSPTGPPPQTPGFPTHSPHSSSLPPSQPFT